MEIGGRKVLVCDCGATMTIDAEGLARACGARDAPSVHRALCRGEIAAFERAIAEGAVLVGCTQEAPLFTETARAAEGADLAFVDIRERAGWGREAGKAGAKIAALIAEAAVAVPPPPGVSFESRGVTLVYGRDEVALEAARRLAPRLDVTVLLDGSTQVMPPRVIEVPVTRGRIVAAKGHLGAFEVTIDGHAAFDPSARTMLAFGPARDGVISRYDLLLDLSGGAPLFPAHRTRDGYLRPDPGDPAAVERALFDLTDLVGTFDKPRTIAFDGALCAHSRSGITGCVRCLDVCPTGAITPAGDTVAIDPHVCAGCGDCASVCPSGAATYALPLPEVVFTRLRTLLGTYFRAGGKVPVLLVHDGREGAEQIAAIGRFGAGLPANMLPFAVNEATQIGLDSLLGALTYGAARVAVLVDARAGDTRAGLASQIGLAEAIMAGLGYGSGRVVVLDERDPSALEARLWEVAVAEPLVPADFLAMGGKRDRLRLALNHLHANAPAPVERLSLSEGAPFGAIRVDSEGCTLCLACVGACPTGALSDNPERPQLGFTEAACIQCGLCRTTCPERVISLEPRLDFTEAVRRRAVLNEEEPYACIRCGKLYGVASLVEKVIARLADHSMFAGDSAALDHLRMCEDCRVAVQFEARAPLAGPPRPRPRTGDDVD